MRKMPSASSHFLIRFYFSYILVDEACITKKLKMDFIASGVSDAD